METKTTEVETKTTEESSINEPVDMKVTGEDKPVIYVTEEIREYEPTP
jgi:hypothetical protein